MLDIRSDECTKTINDCVQIIEQALLTVAGFIVRDSCVDVDKKIVMGPSKLFLRYVSVDNERVKSNLCPVVQEVLVKYIENEKFSIKSDVDLLLFLLDLNKFNKDYTAHIRIDFLCDILSYKGVYYMWYGNDYESNLSERISKVFNSTLSDDVVGFEELGIKIQGTPYHHHYYEYDISSVNDLIYWLDKKAKIGYFCDIKLPDGAAEKLLNYKVVPENSYLYQYLDGLIKCGGYIYGKK